MVRFTLPVYHFVINSKKNHFVINFSCLIFMHVCYRVCLHIVPIISALTRQFANFKLPSFSDKDLRSDSGEAS